LLYLEYSDDVIGLSWSVMLKNVYAMLFGIADELQLGDNMRGFLTVAAIREMQEIVSTVGGSTETCQQLAGLGDLITTATSAGSHHHELGRQLARGERDDIRGEGVHTLAMVEQFSLLDAFRYPLYNLIRSIVASPENIGLRIEQYLASQYVTLPQFTAIVFLE
jgi:glycerol-3-phosphate dehydrogenase (NAD(P)+)